MLKFTGWPWHRKKGWVIACLSQVKGKLSTGTPAFSQEGVSQRRSLPHSLILFPQLLVWQIDIKSATPGTPLTAVSPTRPYKHTNTGAHARVLPPYGPGRWQEGSDFCWPLVMEKTGKVECTYHRKWNSPSRINVVASATTRELTFQHGKWSKLWLSQAWRVGKLF